MAFVPYIAPDYMRTGAVASGALSCTPAWPAHRAGDICVVEVNTFLASDATCDDPTWEELLTIDCNATTSATADHRLAIWGKRATAAEMAANGGVMPNPTFTRGAAGDYIVAFPVTIRGVSEAGTVLDAIEDSAGNTLTSASGTVTWPSLTTTVDQCLLMFFVGGGEDASAINITGGPTNANLIQGAIRVESGAVDGGGGVIGMLTAQAETAGVQGSTTATIFTAAAQSRLCIAFRPPQEADVVDDTVPTTSSTTAPGAVVVADTLRFQVSDTGSNLSAVVVTVSYGSDFSGGAITETAFENGAFTAPFSAGSTLHTDTDSSWDATFARLGGWPSATATFRVSAFDAGGNSVTDTYAYTTDYVADPGDVSPPTAENFIPPVGDPVTRTGPIQFDVLDDSGVFTRIMIIAQFSGIPQPEIVHDGEDFTANYSNSTNDRYVIADGYRYVTLRNGGWPSTQVAITPVAIDAAGNENT